MARSLTARALAVLLAAAALSALLAACGDDGEGGPIRFQLFGDAEELAAYRELVARYPGPGEVQLVEVPDREAHLAKLVTSFGAGDPPDVFLINYRNFGGYAERGVLDPPGQRIDAGAFFPQPVDAFTVGGTLRCVPQNVSSLVVYFNASRFAEAGLDRPSRDWTYADFLRAARELTRDGRHGVGVEPGIVRASAFVWAAGGEVVDDTDRPTGFALDTPEARRGLERLAALRREGLSPDAAGAKARSLEERFVDGSLAMFLSSRREVPAFRTIEGFEWDVAAFPRAERKVSVLHSDAYCVAKDAGEAAYDFVRFASGPEGQRLLARSGRTVPSRPGVAGSEAFLDPSQPPASSQVFLDAVPTLKRLPTVARWTEAEDAADLALERYYYGDLSLDEAIERIERETAPLFAQR